MQQCSLPHSPRQDRGAAQEALGPILGPRLSLMLLTHTATLFPKQMFISPVLWSINRRKRSKSKLPERVLSVGLCKQCGKVQITALLSKGSVPLGNTGAPFIAREHASGALSESSSKRKRQSKCDGFGIREQKGTCAAVYRDVRFRVSPLAFWGERYESSHFQRGRTGRKQDVTLSLSSFTWVSRRDTMSSQRCCNIAAVWRPLTVTLW